MSKLSNKTQPEILLRIDEEEESLYSIICHMKANKSDGPIRLKIRYNSQPAVDTGGVSKQFFQNCFVQMQKTFLGITMFEGNDTRLIPTTNSHMKNSMLPTILGKI